MSCPNESSSSGRPAPRFRWWLTILLVWVVITVPAVLCVWFLVKPSYTASARIEIRPWRVSYGYDDEDHPQRPLFEAYHRAQAEVASCKPVLTAALANPSVKGLPLLKEADPLSALRMCLKVEPLPSTHILQISVTRRTAAEAVALANAVADAYLYQVNEFARKELHELRQFLASEQERLSDAETGKRVRSHYQ